MLSASLICCISEITIVRIISKLSFKNMKQKCKVGSLAGAAAFQKVTRAHLWWNQNVVNASFCECKNINSAWLLDQQVKQGR